MRIKSPAAAAVASIIVPTLSIDLHDYIYHVAHLISGNNRLLGSIIVSGHRINIVKPG